MNNADPRPRHIQVAHALRTGGNDAVGAPKVIAYLRTALQQVNTAEQLQARNILLEALSAALAGHDWIAIRWTWDVNHISFDFNLDRIRPESIPYPPLQLGTLLTAIANNADTPARVPSIALTTKGKHMYYAKPDLDGGYTYMPIHPASTLPAKKAPNLVALVADISKIHEEG